MEQMLWAQHQAALQWAALQQQQVQMQSKQQAQQQQQQQQQQAQGQVQQQPQQQQQFAQEQAQLEQQGGQPQQTSPSTPQSASGQPSAPSQQTVVPWDRHLDHPNIHGTDVWLTQDMLSKRRALLGLDRQEVVSFTQRCEFVSLGCFCAIARALQSIGLKKWSYPFDWTRSPLEGIIHCLDTDFEDFMTFASFRYEGALKVFESTRWGGSFWHHDLEAPGTKEDFTRRIHRLMGRGDVEATTTRVYVRAVNSTREVEQALQLREALRRIHPQAYVYLLLVVDLQPVKGAIRVVGEAGEGILFYCIQETLYTQILATRPNMDGLERIQICSDWYAEAIAFATKFWAGDAEALAEAKVVQTLAAVSGELQQWDGGSAAYQLFCPRKFRGHKVNVSSATQLPGLLDPAAFCDFVLPPNVLPGQLLLVHAFGLGVHFEMPSDVCAGQWLRVTLVKGAASGQIIWPSMPQSGSPAIAATKTVAATFTSPVMEGHG
jgi:hypothetical protein